MLLLLIWSCSVSAAPVFEVRSYNPFTRIYGLPDFFAGELAAPDSSRIGTGLNVINMTEIESGPGGSLELDGETYQLDLRYDRMIGQRLNVGVRVPVIHDSGGWLDRPLGDWHDLLGVPNGDRDIQPSNSLRFHFDDGQGTDFLREESDTGFGDVRFATRYRLSAAGAGRQLAVHAGLKVPTGDAQRLTGSGAFDVSLGMGLSDPVSLARLRTTLSANLGVLLLGEGDVLSRYQRSSVLFGGVQAAVRLTPQLHLIGGIHGVTSYYDMDIAAIGDDTVALVLGGGYRTRNGWRFRFGIVEDGLSRVMPDFALHFGVSKCFGRDC